MNEIVRPQRAMPQNCLHRRMHHHDLALVHTPGLEQARAEKIRLNRGFDSAFTFCLGRNSDRGIRFVLAADRAATGARRAAIGEPAGKLLCPGVTRKIDAAGE
jgi:hypothetical protein